MKYEDGEVVTGTIEFTNTSFDAQRRKWKGTLEFPKRIGVEDEPDIVALGKTWKFDISFTNDYSAVSTDSTLSYHITTRTAKEEI